VGAIIVYDVTNYASFENCKKWHEELTFLAGEKIKILLAGNKIDLVRSNPEKRAVGTNEAQKFASDNGMMFKECSAFTDDNISESFETLLLCK
jgi:Ras-related protein Rab-5C